MLLDSEPDSVQFVCLIFLLCLIFLMLAKMADKLKINLVNAFRSSITSTVKQQRGKCCGFMVGLNKFKPTAPTKLMLWPFSLLPLAEQSDLPCADSMAHSTATQAHKGRHLCWKAATQQKTKQLLSLDWIFQFLDLAYQRGDGSAGWWWIVLHGTSPQIRNTEISLN